MSNPNDLVRVQFDLEVAPTVVVSEPTNSTICTYVRTDVILELITKLEESDAAENGIPVSDLLDNELIKRGLRTVL